MGTWQRLLAITMVLSAGGIDGAAMNKGSTRGSNRGAKHTPRKGPTGRSGLDKGDRDHATYAVTELEVDKLHMPDFCTERTKTGDTVSIKYTGRLVNGKIFDSNTEKDTAFEFSIGAGTVIRGWEEGLLDMCVGEKRLLRIPPSKAYGHAGRPPTIPRGATLVFETELMKIN